MVNKTVKNVINKVRLQIHHILKAQKSAPPAAVFTAAESAPSLTAYFILQQRQWRHQQAQPQTFRRF